MSGLQQTLSLLVKSQSSQIIKNDDIREYSVDLTNKFLFTVDEEGKYHSYSDKPAIIYMESDVRIWMQHGKLFKRGDYAVKTGQFNCNYVYNS